jgi:hypothetical protein
MNDECVTFCAKTQVISIFGGDIAAQNAANYGETALVLEIIDDYIARVIETGDMNQTVEINDNHRMEGPLLWNQQARISVEAGNAGSDAIKGLSIAQKLARFPKIVGPTVCKKCNALPFADADLVYGPTAGGALREFKNKFGGQLLGDMEPGSAKWVAFSKTTMEDALRAGNKIHFDLTHFDPNMDHYFVNGERRIPVTWEEVKYLECFWDRFKNNVIFYLE